VLQIMNKMKKSIEIPSSLQKVWNEYRILKSRSDHFGYKSLLINSYPKPTEEDIKQMKDYSEKYIRLYIESCQVLTTDFLGAYWDDDGSCILSNGLRFQY
jgi:hypothetical protein